MRLLSLSSFSRLKKELFLHVFLPSFSMTVTARRAGEWMVLKEAAIV
jgi:hypothetical protein